MKSIKLSFILLLIITVFVTCKKEGPQGPQGQAGPGNPDPNIYGKWEVISGANEFKYLIINNDKSYYVLFEDTFGFKSQYNDIALITGSQIVIEIGNGYLYNYSVSSSSLTLTNTEDTISLSRNNNVPDQDNWLKKITSLSSINAPIKRATDLAWDGQYIWYGNAYETNYLYKINPLTSYVDSIPTINSAWGIEFDGQYLWTSNNGYDKIFKVDPTTGSNITESVSMGAWIESIAWDGQYLWCWSDNEGTIYKYNPQSNSVVSQYNIGTAGGITYANGYFYLCIYGVLHKCTINPLHAIESYSLENLHIHGITYDGNNFWVSVYNYINGNDNYKIHKVSLN